MDLAEENYNNSKISDIVSNILTLRYNPLQNSSLPELNWKDFVLNDNKISEHIIEEKIENYLQLNLNDSIPAKYGIYLSEFFIEFIINIPPTCANAST